MNLSLHPSGDVLFAYLSGEFSLVEAERTFQQVLEAMEQNNVAKVLLDGRQVTGELTACERFYYGAFVADAVLNKRLAGMPAPRFSYVLRSPVIDPQRLGETVAINRGMNVKAFDDLDEALNWLG